MNNSPQGADSPTPRSDAYQREFESGHGYPLAVHVEAARTLERELTEARAQLATLREREGKLVGALAEALNLAATPEHNQDAEWYAKEKELCALLNPDKEST